MLHIQITRVGKGTEIYWTFHVDRNPFPIIHLLRVNQ